jgi:hypothetical protein
MAPAATPADGQRHPQGPGLNPPPRNDYEVTTVFTSVLEAMLERLIAGALSCGCACGNECKKP